MRVGGKTHLIEETRGRQGLGSLFYNCPLCERWLTFRAHPHSTPMWRPCLQHASLLGTSQDQVLPMASPSLMTLSSARKTEVVQLSPPTSCHPPAHPHAANHLRSDDSGFQQLLSRPCPFLSYPLVSPFLPCLPQAATAPINMRHTLLL